MRGAGRGNGPEKASSVDQAGRIELGTLAASSDIVDLSPAAVVAKRTSVGREAERRVLREAFARASGGQSAFMTVTGEPGMGKTVLVEDFFAELELSPHHPVIARGRSSCSLTICTGPTSRLSICSTT